MKLWFFGVMRKNQFCLPYKRFSDNPFFECRLLEKKREIDEREGEREREREKKREIKREI